MAIFSHQMRQAGLADVFEIGSAAIDGKLMGTPYHEFSVNAFLAHQVDLSGQSRALAPEDLIAADYILAMDRKNIAVLEDLAPEDSILDKIQLLPKLCVYRKPSRGELPDPIGQGQEVFMDAFLVLYDACNELLRRIREERDLS